MAVRDGRGDVKQTTTGFRGPLMVQSLTSAKSKFLSLSPLLKANSYPSVSNTKNFSSEQRKSLKKWSKKNSQSPHIQIQNNK